MYTVMAVIVLHFPYERGMRNLGDFIEVLYVVVSLVQTC